jgi:AP-4 complex subunit epsilon-1
MSSGSHLSKEMHDLVKSIGETRSKQEEDKIILTEQAKLKDKINDKSISVRRQRENLIKSIYIEMLGHDASFSHIHAVNMTQNKQLSLKRLGYLCCCLFLHDNSELLILLVATL